MLFRRDRGSSLFDEIPFPDVRAAIDAGIKCLEVAALELCSNNGSVPASIFSQFNMSRNFDTSTQSVFHLTVLSQGKASPQARGSLIGAKMILLE